MAKSYIDIQFVSIPVVGNVIEFTTTETAFTIKETYVVTRTQNGEVFAGSVSIFAAALELFSTLYVDYSAGNFYLITFDEVDTVRITANNSNVTFGLVQNTTGQTVTIVNEVEIPPIAFSTLVYSEATINDPCTHIKVDVTTNTLTNKVTEPVVIDPNTNNPFQFELLRNINYSILAEDPTTLFTIAILNTNSPKILSASNILLAIINSPSGATVTVTVNETQFDLPTSDPFGISLELEFSLDDINYYTSNIFSGLAIGGYTIYVKDQYGCKVSTPFTIDSLTPSLTPTQPFELVSFENSIRYAKRITSTNCGSYQNSETLLSCEEKVPSSVRYTEIQRFNSCDIITTQIKSNYQTIVATIIKEDGSEDIPVISKITDNIEREDRRDANIIDLGGGEKFLYFTSGYIYDFFTGFVISQYALNGAIPEFGVVGNYINILGIGFVQVKDIITVESVSARGLVFYYAPAILPTVVEIQTQYSVANFEIYEFSVSMAIYNNTQICIKVEMTDPLFTSVEYLSERIEVKTDHIPLRTRNIVDLTYYNTSNGEFLYIDNMGGVRIKNKLRLEVESITAISESDLENFKTDEKTILLNSRLYDGDEFTFHPLTTEMARKLRGALIHNFVTINNVQYTAAEAPEIQRLGTSNLYTVVAKMLKTGKVFNTSIEGIGNETLGGVEIPDLLSAGSDFIKVS